MTALVRAMRTPMPPALRFGMPRDRLDELRALIAQLFGNGEQGVVYIPQPQVLGQQVLYQDAAGTVPVTSDGDPVGLMLDISGNGNHAFQPSSASRPTYRTDGARHWLEFDGVDDKINLPQIPYQTGDLLAVFIAMQRVDDGLRYGSFRSREAVIGRYCGLNHPNVTGTTSDIGGDVMVNGQSVNNDRTDLFAALRTSPAVGSSLGNNAAVLNGAPGEIVSYGSTPPPSATLYGYIEAVGFTANRGDVESYLAKLSGITLEGA